MEDNNTNKNLEQFFNKIFNTDIPREDWNTPDPAVWDNIENQLDRKNKDRRVLLLILPWLLLLGSLSFSAISWNASKQNTQKIKELENIIVDCQQKSTQPYTITTSQTSNSTIISPKSVAALPSTSNDKAVAKQKANKSASATNSYKNISTIAYPSTFEFPKSLLQEEGPNVGSESVAMLSAPPVEQMRLERRIFPISTIDFRAIHPIYDSPLLDRQIPEIHTNKLVNAKFQIGMTADYYHWIDIVQGSLQAPLNELLVSENTRPSAAIGVKASYQLTNKLTVNTGISYNKRKQYSAYLLHLPYSTTMETQDPDGTYANHFNHSLPTGLGNVNTFVTLARAQGNTISDNQIIDVDFSFDHESTSLFVPIGLSYFLQRPNNGFYVYGGLLQEWRLSNKISNVYSLSHHSAVKEKDFHADIEMSTKNAYQLYTQFGLGYQKEISKNLHFNAMGQYGVGLTNVFTDGSYAHSLNYLNISASICKSF